MSREADQRRMKVGAPHPRLSPSLWTAPDESWKPWQQARTQESAKTLAPLKSRSMKRLLVPLFSHTNTTLYTIKTHRRMLTAWTDVHFRSIHLTDWKAASRPLHQHNRGPMWSSQVKMLLHIQKKGWKYCDRYILKSRTSCKSSPWCLYELFKILYSILWTSASEGSAPYPALPCPALPLRVLWLLPTICLESSTSLRAAASKNPFKHTSPILLLKQPLTIITRLTFWLTHHHCILQSHSVNTPEHSGLT